MKMLGFAGFFVSMVVLSSVVYHIGRLDGKADLDRWMAENNVHRFERCPPMPMPKRL